MPDDHRVRPRSERDVRSTISHATARLLSSKAWDGDTTWEELQQLEAHLRECAECRQSAERVWRFLSRLEDVIDKAPLEDLPRPDDEQDGSKPSNPD